MAGACCELCSNPEALGTLPTWGNGVTEDATLQTAVQTWKAVVSIHLPEWLNKWVSCRSHIDSAIDLMAFKTHGGMGTFCSSKQGAISSMLFYGYPMISHMDTSMWYLKVTQWLPFSTASPRALSTRRDSPCGAVVIRQEDLVVLWNDGTTKSAIAPSRHSVAAAYRGRPLDSF